MAHHAEDSYAMRELFARHFNPPGGLGATGRHPNGKLTDNDEGEIKVAIAADPARGVVVIDFGKPTAWIGFTPDQASDIADMLHAKALECRGITS
jgi:hypothetical protein